MADEFQKGLIAAGALIARNIPTSRRLAKLRELIKANAPVDTGALRDSFDDPRTVQLLPDGTIEVDSPLPYARIQDQGGTIPPYDIIAAKGPGHVMRDRKSTRLNSSHSQISYAVFCLKKKRKAE